MLKKLKDIVKTNPEPAKPTFGVNPMDPWSAKAGLAEGALEQYLLSKGINPKFVSKDTKISHSKSSAFLKWKQDHLVEAVDAKDTITFDIPLLIRILELVREDIKSDPDLHRVVEKLISIRNKGVLTMDDYDFVSKLKEEIEFDESINLFSNKKNKFKHGDLANHEMLGRVKVAYMTKHGMRVHSQKDKQTYHVIPSSLKPVTEGTKPTALERFRAASATREKKHNDIEKARQEKLHQDPSKVTIPEPKATDGMTSAIDRLEKHLNKEEVEQIDELKKSTVKSWLGKQEVVPPKKPGMDRKAHNQRIKTRSKSWDRALDRLSGHKPTSEEVERLEESKKEWSKSARIIKSLYKKNGVKESADGQSGGGIMYDKEKTDKPPQGYGKKPSIGTTDKKDHYGDEKPKARAIMTGGKTLTGNKRDDVEIDPSVATRPDKPIEVIKEPNTKKQNN